jgi:hypothetical protein
METHMITRIGRAALLALVLVASASAIWPASARAVASADGRFDCSRLSDNSIAIDGYVAEESSVAIPATMTLEDGSVGQVSAIEWYAFEGCCSISTLTIPPTVTRIGQGAFMRCTSLTAIVVPDSVTNVGSWAFERCTALSTVTAGAGVTRIRSSTFYGCESLRSITVGKRVSAIDSYAFGRCPQLKKFILPNAVTSIGANAFTASTKVRLTPRAKLTRARGGRRSATVRWKRSVAGTVSGFQVRCERHGAPVKTVTAKGSKKRSRVVSKLATGRKYAFQVRPYRTISGRRYYADWSSAKAVKVR